MLSRLVAAGFLALFVGLVIYGARLRTRSTPMYNEIEIRPNGTDWLRTVFIAVGGLPDHRVDGFDDGAVQILWRRRPLWTIAVAVLFFPLGLIALLVVRWEQCSILVTDDGQTSHAHIGGVVSKRAVDAINLTLA